MSSIKTTRSVQVLADGTLAAPDAQTFRTANGLEPAKFNQPNGNGPPTVNDDETQGFVFGSIYVDRAGTPSEIWKCLDPTAGAAEWVNTSLTLEDLGSMAMEDAADYLGINAQAADADPSGAGLSAEFARAVVKDPSGEQTIDAGSGGNDLVLKGRGVFAKLDKIDDAVLPESDAVFEFREKKTTDASVMTKWQVGLRRATQSPEDGALIFRGSLPGGINSAWVSLIDFMWRFVTGIIASVLRADTASGLALQDSTGTEQALLDSQGLRIRPRIVSSNATAALDNVIHVVATATITDPATPAEGRGYIVRVINGTATVGGTGYSVVGTVLHRFYHSGAWQTVRKFAPGDFQPLDADLTAYADAADAAARRALIGAAALLPTVNAQTGTAYTLALTDNGGIVTMENAAANVVTIPTNASVALPVGVVINVEQKGTGSTSITAAAGVTLNGVDGGTLEIGAQYGAMSLRQDAANAWIAQVAENVPEATEAEMRAGTETAVRAMSPVLVRDSTDRRYLLTSKTVRVSDLVFSTTEVLGSGTARVTPGGVIDLDSETTINSRVRFRVNNNMILVTPGSQHVDWSKEIIIKVFIVLVNTATSGLTRFMFGKLTTFSYGLPTGMNFVGFEIQGTSLYGIAGAGADAQSVDLETTASNTGSYFYIISKNGLVEFYDTSTKLGELTGGPISNASSMSISLETENAEDGRNRLIMDFEIVGYA